MNELAVWNPNWLKILGRRTPKQYIKRNEDIGPFDYVEVGYVRRQLDSAFSPLGWSFETQEVTTMETLAKLRQVVVKGRLEIKHPQTGQVIVVKEAYGGVKIKFRKNSDEPLDVGNDYKSAASDALKKCASQLGICADIYEPKVQKTEDYHGEDVQNPSKTLGVAPQEAKGTGKVIGTDKINQVLQRQVAKILRDKAIPDTDFRQWMLDKGLDKVWAMTYDQFNNDFIPWAEAHKWRTHCL